MCVCVNINIQYICIYRKRESESSSLEMSASVEWLLIFSCCTWSADGWMILLDAHLAQKEISGAQMFRSAQPKKKKNPPSLVTELIGPVASPFTMNSAPGAPVLQCIIVWSSIFSRSPPKNMEARVMKRTRGSFARFPRAAMEHRCSARSRIHHFCIVFTANAQEIQHVVGLTMSLITWGWIVSWILFPCACVYLRMSTAAGDTHCVQYCNCCLFSGCPCVSAGLISGRSVNCLYVVDISSFPTSASSVLHGGRWFWF